MPQTYFVTGANRGIGLEFARQLSARGDRVLATCRDPARAAELASVASRVVRLDLTDPASLGALPPELGEQPVDVLICNAGVSAEGKSVATLDGAELRRVLDVNAVAPILVAQALLPALRRGSRKLVCNITSQLGSIANNTGGSTYAYRASKAALNMLTVSMANELRPEGFTCVAVHPGWVRTDMGGPNATLAPDEAVRSMLSVLDKLSPASTGRFLNYDGAPMPW